MKNPYEILEINENATDNQVKDAYLKMQKKYYPDNYEEGPLKKLAIEKSEEITAAFDEIMNQRRMNEAQQGYEHPTAYQENSDQNANTNTASASFSKIRQMIQNQQLTEAEQMLDHMPPNERNAEWYFLKGSVCFARGWLEDAMRFFETASGLDPGNAEYRAALQRMKWQRGGNFGSPSNPYRQPSNMANCSTCDICSSLLCADCCCECMGGDLIPCC